MHKNLVICFSLCFSLAACGGGEASDPCAANPCLNGGTCDLSDDGNTARCDCAEGFEGNLCETVVEDPTDPNNNGDCTPVTDCDGNDINESNISTEVEASCTSAGGSTVRYLTGTITDEAGCPIGCAKAQICIEVAVTEQYLCLRPENTNSEGQFEVTITGDYDCITRGALRVFHASEPMASMYPHVELGGSSAHVAFSESFTLHSTQAPTSLPESTDDDLTYTVAFSHGLEMDVTPGKLSAGPSKYAQLTSVFVAPNEANSLVFAEDALSFEGFYGFSPEGDVIGGGFPIRITGTTLSTGTVVDLYALGGIACTLPSGERIDEGDFMNVGSGTVESDGSVTFPDHVVLPCMTWMGYKVQ